MNSGVIVARAAQIRVPIQITVLRVPDPKGTVRILSILEDASDPPWPMRYPLTAEGLPARRIGK